MVVCLSCGQENPDGFRVCGMCAAPLQEAPPPREERKVVTVLFCDLVGSTAQAERLDPEDVRLVLSRYHERVRGELERHGGTVEKFIGDAVMALFGAPVAHEDDPERAVRAAFAIREWAREQADVQVRIGITTGEALVALSARPERGEGMAAGDVVNTAARLQSAAPVDGILVDETTYRATERQIDYGVEQHVEAKGKSGAVAAWEALQARSRVGVDVRQIDATPLVGRERERALLVETHARVREERTSQLVTIVGVPGIGKSRLVWELFRHIEDEAEITTWRQGRSLSYGEGVSFWALGEIVKAQAGVLETDSEEETAAKIERAVGQLVDDAREAAWVDRHLRPLVGLDVASAQGGQRDEAFAAWRRFLEALAELRPLVLVFEDLQFADDGLLDFVDYLVDWVSGVPMLVVATARPELLSRRPTWSGGKLNAITLSLAPLSDEDTAGLVRAVLERSVLDADVQQSLLDRAGGNPLYAEEFARLLAAGRAPEELPETVQGIVAARLDLLPAEEKELLRDAAVVGKVFWLGALAAIGHGEPWVLEGRLHALERQEFVRRERTPSVAGEKEYAFRHVLVPDVAYGQIPRGERAEKHRLAAEWIEELGRPEDHAEMIAFHYASALELARAAGSDTAGFASRAQHALRDAGDRAFALGALPSAVRFYRAALELCPADDPERPALLFRLARARFPTEAKGFEEASEAVHGLIANGDRATAAEAEVLCADIVWWTGNRAGLEEHLEHAAELVEGLPPTPAKAVVVTNLSRFSMLRSDYDLAIELGREALALAEKLGLRELQARALNTVGVSRAARGEPDGARDVERAIDIAEGVSVVEQTRAINNLASVVGRNGDLRRSLELSESMLRLGREHGLVLAVGWAQAERAVLSYFLGRWDDSLAELDRLAVEFRASPHYMEPICLDTRAAIRLARGDAAGALDDSARALERARTIEDPQGLFPALAARARILLFAGHEREAAGLADELIGLAGAGGSVPDAWFVDLTIALVTLGRAEETLQLASQLVSTLWSGAAEAIAREDWLAAADVLEKIGSLPDEAFARSRAGQVEHAAAFWRSVGATRYLAVEGAATEVRAQ